MRFVAVRSLSALPVLMAGSLPSAANAQTVPLSPPTREEIERLPAAPPPRSDGPRVSVEGDIERAPCPLADPAYQSVTVPLASVEFSGLGPISPDLLRPAYSGLVGQTLPIAQVCEIRDRAATILRQKGYLAAVQVPPQRIDNGVVRFDVLIAKLIGIQVRGDAGKSESAIARYLSAIRDQPIFNILEAERYLLLARDLPGYDIRLTLRPAGTVPGEVIGEALVVHTPVELDLSLQNYGSRDVGRFGGLAQLRLNGLLGFGDRTTLGFYTTADFEEQQVVLASQEFRIGREGLTVGADVNYAWTRPSLGAIDLRSRTLAATLRASYPLVRRQSHNLYASGGFDFINQSTKLFNVGSVPVSRDRLRVLFARLDFDAVDPGSVSSTRGYSISEPRWRASGGIELRQGIGILDATERCNAACTNNAVPPSLIEGDPTAFVVRAQGYFEYRPDPLAGFSLQPRLQYAPHPLLSYEQYSAGNYTIGRGFDPGTLSGDSGAGFRSEATIGSLVPRSRRSVAVQGYGFVDAAWVWNKDSAFDGLDPQRLQSVGGGVRVVYGDRFQIDAGLATPWRRAGLQTARSDTRLLITLTTRLLPWTRR